MRKEVIFAIISGSLLGLVIAFGVWRANQALKNGLANTKKTDIAQATPNSQNQFDLTLAAPSDFSIFTSSTGKVSGVTRPTTYIVVSNQTDDVIEKTDNKGSFEAKVDLSGGLNPLLITSLDPNNGIAEKSLSVIYSSEFKKFLAPTATPSDASDEASIEKKVQEKLAEAENQPTAYVGTITDLTDKTLQIKDATGDIKQISLSEETEYIKTDPSKKLGFKDLAIGDFVAALGFKDKAEVLTGKRILVTSKPEDLAIKAVLGEVVEVDSKGRKLTLKDKHEGQWTAQFGKKWDGPNLKDLEVGTKVIVVGKATDTSLSDTRTLFEVKE